MGIAYADGSVSLLELAKYLALTGQGNGIFSEIVKRKEAVKKAKELNIAVSDQEMQVFSDSYRKQLGLYSAEETRRHLESLGISLDDFERFCEESILSQAATENLADDKTVQEHFINNRAEYDKARVSVIGIGDENLANEILMRVTEDDEDFHALAREFSISGKTKHAGGHVGWMWRSDFRPNIAAKIFGAAQGEVVGPFEVENQYRLFLVEEVQKADLDDEQVKTAIQARIVDEWASRLYRNGLKIDNSPA